MVVLVLLSPIHSKSWVIIIADINIRITLRILKQNIVFRFVLLNEVVLKKKCLGFCFG